MLSQIDFDVCCLSAKAIGIQEKSLFYPTHVPIYTSNALFRFDNILFLNFNMTSAVTSAFLKWWTFLCANQHPIKQMNNWYFFCHLNYEFNILSTNVSMSLRTKNVSTSFQIFPNKQPILIYVYLSGCAPLSGII